MSDSDRPGAGWRNTVLVAAVAALIVRFMFPPVGVVLLMVTTVMAASRFRQLPVVTVLVAVAAVFAATSMPPSFLSAHPLSADEVSHPDFDVGQDGGDGPDDLSRPPG